MNVVRTLVVALALLVAFPAISEVGETDVIDAIATKPGNHRALLLLHQQRPWSTTSVELLRKKLAFYSAAISTKSLVKQHSQLNEKELRVVVLYSESPTPDAVKLLQTAKTEFQSFGASLVWGTRQQLGELAEKP
ncbi:DUF6572 domain-containing protein [Nitrogeniibacter aestuarii]|uniref:DUF6572 domain-containing protein n=1 Tax=Nitrogeniibacter aestuarii TaxID=2815343 RepID=UPI001E622F82|nr:DUF6572 domain-containing protein [Nitrogeniibacter aestuarii]